MTSHGLSQHNPLEGLDKDNGGDRDVIRKFYYLI